MGEIDPTTVINEIDDILKKNNARIMQRQIRKREELLVNMKRELRQVHKLSEMEDGICWWPTTYWWDKEKVKNEELASPLLKKEEPISLPLDIKAEGPPTPDLL